MIEYASYTLEINEVIQPSQAGICVEGNLTIKPYPIMSLCRWLKKFEADTLLVLFPLTTRL